MIFVRKLKRWTMKCTMKRGSIVDCRNTNTRSHVVWRELRRKRDLWIEHKTQWLNNWREFVCVCIYIRIWKWWILKWSFKSESKIVLKGLKRVDLESRPDTVYLYYYSCDGKGKEKETHEFTNQNTFTLSLNL